MGGSTESTLSLNRLTTGRTPAKGGLSAEPEESASDPTLDSVSRLNKVVKERERLLQLFFFIIIIIFYLFVVVVVVASLNQLLCGCSSRASPPTETAARVSPSSRLCPAPHHAVKTCSLPDKSTMDEDNSVLPDLKDIETKVGRKVPESLARSLVGGKHHDEHEKSAAPHSVTRKCCTNSADLKRLESKMLFLKQEMVSAFFSASCVTERIVK